MCEHAGAAGGFMDRDGYPFCAGRMFDVLEPVDEWLAKERFLGLWCVLFHQKRRGLNAMDSIQTFSRTWKKSICAGIEKSDVGLAVLVTSRFCIWVVAPLPLQALQNVLELSEQFDHPLKNKDGFWPWLLFRRMSLDRVAA